MGVSGTDWVGAIRELKLMYLAKIAVSNVCSVTMKRVVCNHYDVHYVFCVISSCR